MILLLLSHSISNGLSWVYVLYNMVQLEISRTMFMVQQVSVVRRVAIPCVLVSTKAPPDTQASFSGAQKARSALGL